jgi:general secretion pathway protein G
LPKHKFKKQKGFTLLELVVVIIVISILGLFAIDRIFAVRVAAEQAAVKQVIGTIKSALGLEVARLALEGKMAAVAKLDKTNPIDLLAQAPGNYLGEKDDSDHITQAGAWYFNKNQKSLIYNVTYAENFKTPLKGTPRIRYRIQLVYNDSNENNSFDPFRDSIAGLDLVAIEKYDWIINTKQLSKKVQQ